MRVDSFEFRGPASSHRTSANSRRALRRFPIGENLEDRQLLAALAPIPDLTVPALQGYTVPLDGSGTADAQTFTARSSNPDIAVSTVSTTFWTIGISYTDPVTSTNSFTGTLTFALFGSLTPNTVKMISEFTNDNYYVNTGDFISRIVTDFAGTPYTVVQGGATAPQGDNNPSGQPNTPYANENVQQLALTGFDQLSIANAGGTDSNDTQFFINTGPLDSAIGYGYTVCGQLVSGEATLAEIAAVPVVQSMLTGEVSEPRNPIKITSASLSAANSNGVVLIDTTQAHPGETAIVTVTATDSAGPSISQASQSFAVTVVPYAGSNLTGAIPTVNFKPYALPVTATTGSYSPVAIQLAGQATFPATPAPAPAYAILSSPAHGTISNFDPATGTATYTPTPGFTGTDSFTYVAYSNGPNSSGGTASSNPATVTINVNQGGVTLKTVDIFTNGRNRVTRLELFWSGPLSPSRAKSKAPFRLATANRLGSFTGRGVGTIAIRKVVYNASAWTVTLTPGTLFPRNKNIELLVHGNGSNALKDFFGNFITGSGGQPGTDVVKIV